MSAKAVLEEVGEPDQISRKNNPLLLTYGCVSLTFLRSSDSRSPLLRVVLVALSNYPDGTPTALLFDDFNQLGDLSALQFARYLETNGYPSYLAQNVGGQGEVMFPSGVNATFKS